MLAISTYFRYALLKYSMPILDNGILSYGDQRSDFQKKSTKTWFLKKTCDLQKSTRSHLNIIQFPPPMNWNLFVVVGTST